MVRRVGRGKFIRRFGRVAGFAAKTLSGPILAAVAKRFINVIGLHATPLTLNTVGIPTKTILTQIPRNITSTDLQQDNRVGRRVFIKGLTVKTQYHSGANSPRVQYRMILIRQSDAGDTLPSTTNINSPIGNTRGFKILFDRTFMLENGTLTNNPNTMKTINKYVRVNAFTDYEGNQTNGTDNDRGAVVLYQIVDGDTSVTNPTVVVTGDITVSYKELL